jgi:hypothetical protein
VSVALASPSGFASALVFSPSLVLGPAADVLLTGGAARLSPATVPEPHSGTLQSGDGAGRERLLLEDSPSVETGTTESARRSPAVLGTKGRPHLPGDPWSDDRASDPLAAFP